MKKDLTIITITYNNFAELKKTVDSIAHLNIHFIIVDGGDCKYSKEYCEKNLASLIYIKERDRGISDAYNKGILNCQTQYLTFLNSGDILTNTKSLTDSINYLNNHKDISFTHSNMIMHDSLAGKISKSPKKCSLGRGMPYFFPTMVFRKKIFHESGMFSLDFKIAMDFEWLARAQGLHQVKGYFIDSDPSVCFDGNGVSSTQEWNGIKECTRALYQNHLLFDEFLFLAKRVSLFAIRKGLAASPLKSLLIKYKRRHNVFLPSKLVKKDQFKIIDCPK